MKTALYDAHVSLGAKIVEFNGWEMPIQYKGIIHEHLAVRTQVGVFDISHMGRIGVEGPGAEGLLDYLATNRLVGKQDGTATYTVWCNSAGMCVDDLIVYKESAHKFFVVVNAGNRQKDLAHLQAYAKEWNSKALEVKVTDFYQTDGILALQGPFAEEILSNLILEVQPLLPMHFATFFYRAQAVIISRTGYTGAGGFEIYAPNAVIVQLWNDFIDEYEVSPIGLGARDTLRLEKGYALYGHELSEEIAACESVSAWSIKWGKPDFLGKSALEAIQGSTSKRTAYGVVMQDKGIAREGYLVFFAGQQIGKVTSGTHSPSLNQAIALILVDKTLQIGDEVEIQIRQHNCRAIVAKLPFL